MCRYEVRIMEYKQCYNSLIMKINKEIRKQAIKKMIVRYEKLQSEVSPYGHSADDGMKYYYLIDYWEDRLNEL